MELQRTEYLLQQYIIDQATPEEVSELMSVLQSDEADPALEQALLSVVNNMKDQQNPYPVNWDQNWKNIQQQIKPAPVRHIRRWYWVAAASLLLLLAITITLKKTQKQSSFDNEQIASNDIAAPKSSKARIMLADGRTISVDSISNGTIATQGGTNINISNGAIQYHQNNTINSTVNQFNTLDNPKGSPVIGITLSDGTQAWLNAGSSITYPVAFNGSDRNVSITGEAYFEVAHNAAKPFRVAANGTTTEVLGTHFNINSYTDETATKITLLEGKVKVTTAATSGGPQSANVLNPSQQAVVTNATIKRLNNVNTDAVIAWKNGFFNFNKTDVKDVMRQLSRWYDLEIVYEGVPRPKTINGKMEMNLNLSQVMNVLKKLQVNYRLENKKITILP